MLHRKISKSGTRCATPQTLTPGAPDAAAVVARKTRRAGLSSCGPVWVLFRGASLCISVRAASLFVSRPQLAMEKKRRKHESGAGAAKLRANEVRVTSGGKLKHYCSYVMKLLGDGGAGRLACDCLSFCASPACESSRAAAPTRGDLFCQ